MIEIKTEIEVFLNGRLILAVSDTEEPEPDLECVLKRAVKDAILYAPVCEEHDHA